MSLIALCAIAFCCLFSVFIGYQEVFTTSYSDAVNSIFPKQPYFRHLIEASNSLLSPPKHLLGSSNTHMTRIHRHKDRTDSYQCSEQEITFQFENYDLVDPNICDSDYAWLQAQLTLRDASVFIDVGGNVGYTAARMFGMWSPGHGYNRKELKKGIMEDVKLKLRQGDGTLDTVCGDGSKSDTPMLCYGTTNCNFRHQITVYAFDGQTMHVNSTKRVVYKNFPHLRPDYDVNKLNSEVKATFYYINAAVTSEVPEGVTHGYFREVNHEGGKLEFLDDKNSRPEKGTILIPVTTVDKFCEERNIAVVDVLKIDAEGGDIAGYTWMNIISYILMYDVYF